MIAAPLTELVTTALLCMDWILKPENTSKHKYARRNAIDKDDAEPAPYIERIIPMYLNNTNANLAATDVLLTHCVAIVAADDDVDDTTAFIALAPSRGWRPAQQNWTTWLPPTVCSHPVRAWPVCPHIIPFVPWG